MTISTPDQPLSSNVLPPVLLSATPTGTAGSMSIALDFNTAMAAGSGAIIITDGAVETVIDRATGQPTMRVVGATDTHTLSASQAVIDGNHVTLNVAGLLAGHSYSVVMGAGVLVSSGHVAFGGVRSTSQLQFSTPGPTDTTPPAVLSVGVDGSTLAANGTMTVTIKFTEAVTIPGVDALSAPNASITGLQSTEDGHTWVATLKAPAGAVTAASNLLTLDMSKVHDTAGNAGAGAAQLTTYQVDTQAPIGVSIVLGADTLKDGATTGVTFRFSEAVKDFASAISTPNASLSHLSSTDGLTWTAQLTAAGANTSSGNAVSVDLSRVTDLAGNSGSGSFASSTYKVDTVHPTVAAFKLDGDTVSSGHGVGFTITFSEAVKTLSPGVFSAPLASVSGLHSDDGVTWTGTLTATAGATATGKQLGIDLGQVSDLAGNAGSGSATAATAYNVDTQGPGATILLSGTELKYGETIVVTITLSDKLDALPPGALTAPNAAITDLHTTDGGLTWTATLKASGNAVSATNAVTLDLSALHDANGNAGTISHSVNYTADNAVAAYVGAFIGIDDHTGPNNHDYVSSLADQEVYGSVSEALQAGQHLVVTVDGGSVPAGFDGLSWYSGDDHDFMLHLKDGLHTIVASVVDDAGHSSAAVTQQFTIDTTDPFLVSSPNGATEVAPGAPLSFTFNEAMFLPGDDSIPEFRFIDAEGEELSVVIGDGNLSADRKTVTIPGSQLTGLLPDKAYTVYLPTDLTDQAGNWAMTEAPLHFHTSAALRATSATAEVWQGIYGIGAEIMIDVVFNKVVRVGETDLPVLHLSNGGQAVLDHQSEDQQTLVFKYTVGANGEADSGALGFADNNGLAGHVHDLDGNILDTAHISYSGLATMDGYIGPIQIDAHAPPAPGAPLLAGASDTGVIGDGLTSAQQPALTGSGAASFATIKLFEGDTLLASTHANVDGNWTIGASDWQSLGSTLADGPHSLVVRQYDPADNKSPVSGALALSVDSAAPGAPGKPVLAASSDSGASNSDGITNVKTPTITGTAAEAGGTIELYDGDTLLGSAAVGADKSWSLTIGSKSALADGLHTLSARQVDAAGNHSTASPGLQVTIDTTAPAITASTSATRAGNNWFDLSFSEKIVFASNSAIDVLDVLDKPHSHHSWDVQTNWGIVNDGQGVASVLELNLGTVAGVYHLQNANGAIQDLAGNAAIIGSPEFNAGPTL